MSVSYQTHTNQIPVDVLASLSSNGKPYNQAFLMESCFDTSITSHPDYQQGLSSGICMYFDDGGYQEDIRSGHVYACLDDIIETELLAFSLSAADLPYRVGWVHGWLSALALAHHDLALTGLELLYAMLARLQGGAVC